MKIKQALNNLKKNIFCNTFYLKGNDHFLQQFFIQKVSALTFKNDLTNKFIISPDDTNGLNIIDQILINDLFSSNKIFLLKEPQKLKLKQQNDLFQYCKNPINNHLLFLINDDWFKKTNYLNKLEKLMGFIDVQTPSIYEMKKWIMYLFKIKGRDVDDKVVNNLLEMAGDSLSNINNEIEKICLFINEKKIVNCNEIKQLSGWGKSAQKWEFLLSIGERNFDDAIFLVKILLSNGISVLSLVYPLTAFFQELFYVKMNNGTISNYSGYIYLPLSIKNKIIDFVKNYSIEEIERGLIELGKLDKKQKTKNTIDEADLIQFIGELVET